MHRRYYFRAEYIRLNSWKSLYLLQGKDFAKFHEFANPVKACNHRGSEAFIIVIGPKSPQSPGIATDNFCQNPLICKGS